MRFVHTSLIAILAMSLLTIPTACMADPLPTTRPAAPERSDLTRDMHNMMGKEKGRKEKGTERKGDIQQFG